MPRLQPQPAAKRAKRAKQNQDLPKTPPTVVAGRTVWVYDGPARRVEWNGVVFDLTGPEIAIDAPEGEERAPDHQKQPKETAEDRENREARDRERVAMVVRGALAGQVRPGIAVVRRCPAKLLPDDSLAGWRRALGWAMARRVSSRIVKQPERLVSVLTRGTGQRPEGFPGSQEKVWAAEVPEWTR